MNIHLEILVEDQSGETMLKHIMEKFDSSLFTFKIHSYKGIGHIPRNMVTNIDAHKRHLLNQLPRLLAGYGKAFKAYGAEYLAAVLVICDLDDKYKDDFLKELKKILLSCMHPPTTRFCLCIEEGEAWLLGDKAAVLLAYPNAKKAVLDKYEYDSTCGTWEVLSDAIVAGGRASLQNKGYSEIGRLKSIWSDNIAPNIEFKSNKSPSFQFFVKTVSELIE